MDRPYNEANCRTIHYYGSASFTDGAFFLYGYKEGECLTADVITEELWL
ncbi:unnamed protein product [marine sediment metagenome]|uniref:Uncharacterized protein n=1 Tax=marine sediment metagenome TaxID=412755 RepID=X1QBG0_9ZZZZ